MPTVVIYVVAGMLIVGAAPLPYGYYMLLRLVACVAFGFAAYVAFERKRKLLPWAYGFLALVFNPLIKVHLPKEVWAVVDVVSGLFLILTAKAIKSPGDVSAGR